MIEITLRGYLTEALKPVPVYLEQPTDAPTSYVLIERTGGGSEDHLKTARCAIQAYGGSLYEASSLNDAVMDAMEAAYSDPKISSARLNASYNYTDTTKKLYRYQAVYDIVYFD